MKTKLLIILLAIFLIAGTTWAGWFAHSPGEKTADAIIYASHCYLSGIEIITDGTNDAKVILYDNASAASGTVKGEFTVVSTDHYGGRSWVNPVECFNGIYADVSGTGASYIVEYIIR